MNGFTLVLGGVRSGKSAFAEQLASATGPRVLYVATAVVADAEMEERVRRHRARRPSSWGLIDEPLDLSRAIGQAGEDWDAVLLDSVSGWLGNLVLRKLDSRHAGVVESGEDIESSPIDQGGQSELRRQLEQEAMAGIGALLARIRERGLRLVAVSDEAGLSLVPPNATGRLFQDLLGSVNQMLAAAADSVSLVVAGLPLKLKGAPDCFSAPPEPHDPNRR